MHNGFESKIIISFSQMKPYHAPGSSFARRKSRRNCRSRRRRKLIRCIVRYRNETSLRFRNKLDISRRPTRRSSPHNRRNDPISTRTESCRIGIDHRCTDRNRTHPTCLHSHNRRHSDPTAKRTLRRGT